MGAKAIRRQGSKTDGESVRDHTRALIRQKLREGATFARSPTEHFAQGCGCSRCRVWSQKASETPPEASP